MWLSKELWNITSKCIGILSCTSWVAEFFRKEWYHLNLRVYLRIKEFAQIQQVICNFNFNFSCRLLAVCFSLSVCVVVKTRSEKWDDEDWDQTRSACEKRNQSLLVHAPNSGTRSHSYCRLIKTRQILGEKGDWKLSTLVINSVMESL